MRTIILLQSIIILLGAYYMYTLRAVPVEQTSIPVVQTIPATTTNEVREGYTAPTTQPPKDTAESDRATTSGVTGPNDAGMEYPTMQ